MLSILWVQQLYSNKAGRGRSRCSCQMAGWDHEGDVSRTACKAGPMQHPHLCSVSVNVTLIASPRLRHLDCVCVRLCSAGHIIAFSLCPMLCCTQLPPCLFHDQPPKVVAVGYSHGQPRTLQCRMTYTALHETVLSRPFRMMSLRMNPSKAL